EPVRQSLRCPCLHRGRICDGSGNHQRYGLAAGPVADFPPATEVDPWKVVKARECPGGRAFRNH
ncbi:MAG TPA: hypothetical protein VI029_11335, partial [Mycobacterium sp.]